MIRRLIAVVATIGATFLGAVVAPGCAHAERRVALVVGNSAYQSVPQLPNPARDATAMAKMLREAGFDTVETLSNVGNLEFKRAIRKFETAADQADIAVVYYAGHGLEIGGTNYLIPVDARLASDRDAEDEAIPLERLVSSADGAKRLRLIILDACRDNPFVSVMRRERRNLATRSVSGGLGKVEPTMSDTLIAYAAKAGSTADDGDGEHSPFTTSILRNLPVPGLDIRLAFGRVRDEVLRATANRQEPYVYGALGGGTISLVPAPAVLREAPASDVKADFDLVQKIGTRRAWEVFLATHPTGFYADLARAQMEALGSQPQQGTVQVAAYPQTAPASRDAPPTKEQLEWEKIKDSVDIPALQRFVKRFPDAPLAITAQQRIDMLKQAIQEREDKARADREAARQAAEEARRKAEAEKAEIAAQKKREEDERRAREAEAAERARTAAAAAAAEKKRQEEERRAAAAEAERQARATEAERKAQEAKRKAEQAERDRLAASAAAAKAAAEKQAKEAEEARKTAEAAAAKEAACKTQQARLDSIIAKGSEAGGIDELKAYSKTITCERLTPVVNATIERFSAELARRAASQPNSPQLVSAAQSELVRIGCLTGRPDGKLTDPTKAALVRYFAIGGQAVEADKVSVTQDLVGELSRHTSRVCPLQCKADETLKGDTCVANDKPAASASRKSDDEDKPRRKSSTREADREPARRAKPENDAPRARQQAVARPSIVSGGGGHSTMIGVGF